MPDQLLTIGELSRRTGVAASALRYYEELGLLPAPSRAGGQRRYPESIVELVGMILLLRDVGFTLAETKVFLASRSNAPDAWRELAHQKVVEIEGRIARAQVARVALQHALGCPHEHVLDCPNFAGMVAARLAGRPLEEAHPH